MPFGSDVVKMSNSRKSKRELIFKRKQEIAVKDLLLRKHVLADLPTGYEKSLISTSFLLAYENITKMIKLLTVAVFSLFLLYTVL